MPASTRRQFVVSQQVVPFVINAVLNGWIAWAMHRGEDAVPLWGTHGYAGDLVATGILLPGITWLILRPLLLKQAAVGKAPARDGVPEPWLSRHLPGTHWRGAAVIGLAGGAIGLLASGLAHALGLLSMPPAAYALCKGLYGGMLSVLLQPAMVFAILRPVQLTAARAD